MGATMAFMEDDGITIYNPLFFITCAQHFATVRCLLTVMAMAYSPVLWKSNSEMGPPQPEKSYQPV